MASPDAPAGSRRPAGPDPRRARQRGRQTPARACSRRARHTRVVPELRRPSTSRSARASRSEPGQATARTPAELAAVTFASDAIARLAAEGELTTDDAARDRRRARRGARPSTLQATRFSLFSSAIANARPARAAAARRRGYPATAAPRPRPLPEHLALATHRHRPAGVHPPARRRRVGRRTRSEARAVLRGRNSLQIVGRSSPALGADRPRSTRSSAPWSARRSATTATRRRVPVGGGAGARAGARARAAARAQPATRDGSRQLGESASDAARRSTSTTARSRTSSRSAPTCTSAAAAVPVRAREPARARLRPLRRPHARLGELDRALREIAHSLESKSIVSRPLGEILHREVDTFAERTGIARGLEVRGDPESLDSAQRVAIFRAIQEALANVREHSGATEVEIRLPRPPQLDRRADHRQRRRLRGQPRPRAGRASAAASASSASASACACSAARSISTASRAARRRSRSRCRAGSKTTTNRRVAPCTGRAGAPPALRPA